MKEKAIWRQEQAAREPLLEIPINELGSAVRYHRKKAHLTQQELAKLAGVGKTVIFDIEKGKISVQLDTLLKVLKVANITIFLRSPLTEKYLRDRNAKS